MLNRIRAWMARKPEPAPGAPPRLKIYSAQSGYVYHYYATRRRRFEFTFNVSADRKTWMSVTVRLEERAVLAWEKAHERVLRDQERYALAKMALFAAFDERAEPESMRTGVHAGSAQIEEIAETLNL